jgi:hypothetical protein
VPGAPASALIPFDGRVARPGVYEVWSALPARGRNVGASQVHTDVIARGEEHVEDGSQAMAGGGFHPITGRFKLTGRSGEGLVLATGGRAAQSLAVDTVLLRRVADAGDLASGAVCTSSTQCSGDLVCASGRCAAGCETQGCAEGTTCSPTGLCVSAVSAEVRMIAMAAQTVGRALGQPVQAQPVQPSAVRTVEATAAGAPSAHGSGQHMKSVGQVLRALGTTVIGVHAVGANAR